MTEQLQMFTDAKPANRLLVFRGPGQSSNIRWSMYGVCSGHGFLF